MTRQYLTPLLMGLLFSTLAPGCAPDPRTSSALADALVGGPIRTYAGLQANTVAETCLVLQMQVVPDENGLIDLAAAQSSWRKARLAYDRGEPLFLVVAPELDFEIDGPPGDVFAVGGLRQVERALFSQPVASAEQLALLTQDLRDSTIELHLAVDEGVRPTSAPGLVSSMAALASLLATRIDGSGSPYAGAADAVASAQNSLLGIQAMYGELSPVVQGDAPELDVEITTHLRDMLGELSGLTSFDQLADKPAYLRQCAELSIAISGLGKALGFPVTVLDLS